LGAVVAARLRDREAIPALCYNLARAPDSRDRNPEYAMRLRSVFEEQGFPVEYGESIQ